jgi:hypothetical protein
MLQVAQHVHPAPVPQCGGGSASGATHGPIGGPSLLASWVVSCVGGDFPLHAATRTTATTTFMPVDLARIAPRADAENA